MDIAALTSGSAATKSAESSGKKLAADFDNFLKLLTTQLANQDPLSPMDSNEFTAQLVRFTQVEQAISQNKKLEELVALQNSSQSMAAVGYIGKTIEAEGDKNNLTDTGAKWSYSIPQESAQTVILVRNSAGNIVYAGTGETLKGDHVFNWDGKSTQGTPQPKGTYQVQVMAKDAQGSSMVVDTGLIGKVTGVDTVDGETMLAIGSVGVGLGKVRGVTA